MASRYGDDVCVICCKQYAGDTSEKLVKVTDGRVALMECSIQHCNSELSEYLLTNPPVVCVHESCRRDYRYLSVQQSKRPAGVAEGETSKSKFLRSCTDSFDWKKIVFFCVVSWL